MFKKEMQMVYANRSVGNGDYIIKNKKGESFIETLLKAERDFLEILENDAGLWLDEGGWIKEGNPEEFEDYLKYLEKRQQEITNILFQKMRKDKS